MKILHIISGGEVGGSKNHLLSVVEAMKGKNVENIIVCFTEGKLYREAMELGLDIRLVRQERRLDLSIVERIRKICELEAVDIINCHGGRANFVGYFLKRKYRAIYTTTIHSDYKEDYRGNFYKTLVYSNINRIVLKSFDYYITVSENFKKMLVERGFKGERIFVVYNGINFERAAEDMSREEIINKYSLGDAGHFVTMVARFHPVKGHRVFLDACRSVIEKFTDVSFLLVGDGAAREEMMGYAREIGVYEYTKFTGFTKPDEFIYISDFTVLASYTESFPLTILESAAYGKAVVSTEVGGIPDLIEDGINGNLVGVGDSSGLAEKMLWLLKNSDKAAEMGQRLYRKARENYSIDGLVNSYINIYSEILSKGGCR